MKIGKPIQEIKKLCASQGTELSNEEISIVLKNYHEIMFDKLVKGEDVKIESIGKISTSIISMHSNFDQQKYETVKFKFSPFTELKSSSKEKLSKVQKKNL